MENMTVKLDSFSGPLDLLYHLIEKNEIDIYDIPIAALTDQYIEFISREENRNMDGMSEFVLMAATLIEIKSRMLLPKPAENEDEADPREELVQKLLEYKRFKGITETLAMKGEEASRTLFRERDPIIDELMKAVEPGAVILLHDFYPTSVDAALQVVDALQAQGYTFVTVQELFELAAEEAEPGCLYRAPGKAGYEY